MWRKFVFTILSALFLGILFMASLTKAQEAQASCKTAISGFVKAQMAQIGVCTKQMNFKNQKEKKEKWWCLLKCVGVNSKMLNPEGLLDRATIESYLKDNVPETLTEKVKVLTETCYPLGDGVLDKNEALCTSYQPLMKCVLDGFPKLCD